MFDNLNSQEKYGLAGFIVVALLMAFSAGAVASSSGSPTGMFFDGGDDIGEDGIESKVDSWMSSQIESQRSQMRVVANRSENLSVEELSIDYRIESVSESGIDGLYIVNATMYGNVPDLRNGGTREFEQSRAVYISEDGNYLFQKPREF